MPIADAKTIPLSLEVFLASPGDVADERALAREVIDRVRGERLFRGHVSIDVIAWDQPGGEVAMEAGLTPQAAIAQWLPKPADCDLVVVLLWSRMGTPLPADYLKPDGHPYRSGTEWEFENAIAGFKENGSPNVWLYHRDQVPNPAFDDPEYDDKREQWRKVQSFLASLSNDDGSIERGIN